MMLEVRPPLLEDIEKILKIDSGWSKSEFYSFLNNKINVNRVYVADFGKVCGFITAEFPSELDEPIIINKLFVDENCRLKGVGRKLFSYIYGMAASRKYKKIEIIIDENNVNGLNFIKKIAHIEKSECIRGKYHLTINSE